MTDRNPTDPHPGDLWVELGNPRRLWFVIAGGGRYRDVVALFMTSKSPGTWRLSWGMGYVFPPPELLVDGDNL